MAFYQNYPTYQPIYQSYPQMQQPQVQQQVQPQQIQNGGFVSVRNEMEARNYPVAPGNSVTFKDENAPFVYTKTMGFSQLDLPKFDRYRLVKEEVVQDTQIPVETPQTENAPHYVTEAEFADVRGQIEVLQKEIDALKEQTSKKPAPKAKKEEKEDEER